VTQVPSSSEPSGGAAASLAKYAWLSIAAAVLTITMKSAAYVITGSVGLLSDALESVVNLVAAIIALVALRVAAKPADESHPFGHGKVEYFSAGAEGIMIFGAAAAIVITAIQRLMHPQALDDVGLGLAITLAATAVNGFVGTLLLRVGRRNRSITLIADGKHLLTDVWTSFGVVVGVLLVGITGWLRLDPIIALLVGLNILVTGFGLIRHSTRGLMDAALPAADQQRVVDTLRGFASDEVSFHGLQTRESGRHRFVSVHVLVPGAWSVQQGHDLLEEVESAVRAALPECDVHTHLEPREDPRAYQDSQGGVSVLSTDDAGSAPPA
jgi:cation diffusion facilitator family transporter